MSELINLMNNAIILIAIIVVGGAGALLEWVQICNLAKNWKRGRAGARRRPRVRIPYPSFIDLFCQSSNELYRCDS